MLMRLFKKFLSQKKTSKTDEKRLFDSKTTARIVLSRLCTDIWTWHVLSNILVIPRLPFFEKNICNRTGNIFLKRLREETGKHLYRRWSTFSSKIIQRLDQYAQTFTESICLWTTLSFINLLLLVLWHDFILEIMTYWQQLKDKRNLCEYL